MTNAKRIKAAKEFIALHNDEIRASMEMAEDKDWLNVYYDYLQYGEVEISRFESKTGNPILFTD